ncbi:MAG: threonine/serine dehydratase [Fusobacterium sp. JB021]|nr:threonine/serine dehydratase [Fusobacterium sp. JB021]
MVDLEKIKEAKERINEYIFKTPLIRMEILDEILNCEVYLKAECMQKTNSFKIRGALNKMLSLPKEKIEKGVIAASSGNHGKGVAFAAKLLNIPATIVLPENAPKIKIEGIQKLGAKTVLCELSERHKIAKQLSVENDYTIIHPYDDYKIIEGQGTIGLEIMEQQKDLDYVVVPIGGGGLIGGISTAVKSINSNVKVIGIEPERLRRYGKSLEEGKRVLLNQEKSLADALLTIQPGEKNYPIVIKNVDKFSFSSDEYLKKGTDILLNQGKILSEFSSASVIGAVLQGNLKFNKKDKVCFVISGGNISMSQIIKEGE